MHLLIVHYKQKKIKLIVKVLKLENQCFTYDFAKTRVDYQNLLKTVQYDAVLSAYNMSSFTGLDVWQWQQEHNLQIPLILIGEGLEAQTAVNCIKAGISDYIEQDNLSDLPEVLQRSLVEVALGRQEKIAINQMRASAQREAIINQILNAMHGNLVINEVLQTTVDLLHKALNVSRCIVSLLDRDQQSQVVSASINNTDRSQLIAQNCCLFKFYEATLRKGNPVLVSDIEQHELPSEILLMAKNQELRAFLIAPLLNQDGYLGHIALHQCDQKREWTADDIILMNTISDQCAIAIKQAKFVDKIQQQAKRYQLLNKMSRDLNSQLDPTYILSKIVRHTGEFFQVDRVVIFSIKNKQVKVVNEWKATEGVPSLVGFQAPLSEWSDPVADSELQGNCFFAEFNYDNLQNSDSWEQQLAQGKILSLLRVPIYIRDQFFGAISLHSTKEDRSFDPDEIQLLKRIADQAAIALYNAQSYERLEQLVKQRTQELEQEKILSEAANRTKTEFLNNMSHELRTPLTGILGFSNVLTQEVFGPLTKQQKEYIVSISECGEHLLNLINNLLDLSKIEANEENLYPQTLVVEEICSSCLSLVKERAKNQGLELHNEIAPDVSFCVGDPRRIKQILFNLLSNGIKFTKEGSVTLKVWQNETRIYFSAIDTGIGIPESDQGLIFQPFYQLDRGLSRKYGGTGLGLALSQKLAQMHGGDITLESEVERGSCFTFWLPLNYDQIHRECPIDGWESTEQETINHNSDYDMNKFNPQS